MGDSEGIILDEDQVEEYNARARVLMVPGEERRDFINLLDALAGLYAEGDDGDVIAEAASDLAAALEDDE